MKNGKIFSERLLKNDPDTESVIENARENGSTSMNAAIFGSIVGFNDWRREQMDKNGI